MIQDVSAPTEPELPVAAVWEGDGVPTDPRFRYQLLPDLSPEDFATLKADIAERGVLVAIEVDEQGAILDGHQRIRAWEALKVEHKRVKAYPRTVVKGLTEDAKYERSLVVNLHRRHLGIEDRQRLIALLRERGWSVAKIVAATNVSESTIHSDLRSGGAASAPPEKVLGVDGKQYSVPETAPKPTPDKPPRTQRSRSKPSFTPVPKGTPHTPRTRPASEPTEPYEPELPAAAVWEGDDPRMALESLVEATVGQSARGMADEIQEEYLRGALEVGMKAARWFSEYNATLQERIVSTVHAARNGA